MAKKTSTYEDFSFLNFNRPVRRKAVVVMKESMSIHGFAPNKPILVTESLKIIDGQHRFIAARELKIPFYYDTFEGTEEEALVFMRDMNTATAPWTFKNYHEFFCNIQHRNREFYQFIDELCKKYDISVSNIYALIFQSKVSKKASSLITRGLVGFDMISREALETRVMKVCEVLELLSNVSPKYIKFFYSTPCIAALVKILSYIDKETLKERIVLGRSKLFPCRSVGDYLSMFEEVVNFGKKTRIPLSELLSESDGFKLLVENTHDEA